MTSVVLVNGDPLTTGRWEECGVRNTRCLVKAVNFQAIRENYFFSFLIFFLSKSKKKLSR